MTTALARRIDPEPEDVALAARPGGLTLTPDISGALWIDAHRALIVADLHLEKGSCLAGRGALLPPYDSAATLDALAGAVVRRAPRLIVALGDSFHDRRGDARLSLEDRARLARLQSGRDWIWIAGNHDPAPPDGLGGEARETLRLGPLILRHEPASAPETHAFEIAGHLHPAARIAGRGRLQRRRAFVSNQGRCVLPAFGAYAGGLNVLDAAIARLFAGPFQVHALGRGRVYAIARVALRPDR